MILTTILPGVVHVDFPNIVLMAKHLGRAQEYAENPRLTGTVFSWSRLKKYVRSRGGDHRSTCYCKSALGYNIPSWALEPFFDGRFQLTKYEKSMLDALRGIPTAEDGTFYVIATADGSATKERYEALDHEICHALWATNPSYKQEVQEVLVTYPDLPVIIKKITKWGIYAPHVIEDEAHAYLATDKVAVLTGRFNLQATPQLEEVHSRLSDILQKYKGE